ncbi:MAG TPA: BON domain-containing protein [Pseudomonadales bacterium]|nr:BON domain-containing protein [Pseudomonadales bacterium]
MRSMTVAFLIASSLGGCTTMLSAVAPDEGIKEDPTDRTMGTLIDDEVLESFAAVNLRKAAPGLAESHLDVTSFNGVVLLTGQVRAEALRRQAEEVVLGLKNVRRVYNELEVAGPTSFLTRSSDTWITGKVKSLLVASDAVPGSDIKVVTENGIVYLMGLVTRADADAAAERTRNIGGVRKVVRIFEYVD